MKTGMMVAALMVAAGPALTQKASGDAEAGDAEAGEAVFGQCATCHVVADPEGNMLAGRTGRVGPNLYGVAGRKAGTVEDFNYSSAMTEAGEAGLAWTEEAFVAYIQDPGGFLKDYLDDDAARGKMVFQLRDEAEAANVYAYLASLGGGAGGEGEDAAATE